METWFCSFLMNFFQFFLLRSVTHAHVADASSPHVCTDEWHSTASTLCPLSLPRKKAKAVSPSYAQIKAQMDHPREFPNYW